MFNMATWFRLRHNVLNIKLYEYKLQQNERRCYIATSSLIRWIHIQNDPCILSKTCLVKIEICNKIRLYVIIYICIYIYIVTNHRDRINNIMKESMLIMKKIWCHGMKTLSASPALCEGIYRRCDVLGFLWCWPENVFEKKKKKKKMPSYRQFETPWRHGWHLIVISWQTLQFRDTALRRIR